MRIIMLASGTRGDIQPFVALGAGLKKNGYKVCIAAPKNFSSYIESNGLEFYAIQGDTAEFMNREEIMNQMKAKNPVSFLLSFRKMNHAFLSEFKELQEKTWEACQSADAIIYHPGMINGYYISKELKIPGIMASPIPFSPTSAFPSLLFYNGPRLGHLYNRIMHEIFMNIFWGSLKTSVVDFWKKRQIKIPSKNPLKQIHHENIPILYAFSKHVIPAPEDWKDNIQITGYWFPENEPNWGPPDELVSFLNDGSSPVYVGFGSIQGEEAEIRLRKVIEALRLMNHRIVLSSDSSNQDWENDPSIYHLKFAPHLWLFPRMKAVVHHGGAGTTAAGFSSGVPSIIIPHSNDQPMWAKIVSELGVGKCITTKKLDKMMIDDIVQVLSDILNSEIKENAKKLGISIRAEKGIENAVMYVSEYLSK